MLRWCRRTMPPKFEIHLKGVLVTCVGILASSLGVFVVRRPAFLPLVPRLHSTDP